MPKLIGGIFCTVGLVASIAAGYCYWSTENLLKTGLRAQGKVVEMLRSGKSYTPVVQFETAEHKTITQASKVGSNPPSHKVADSVTVLYHADDPEDFRIDEPLEIWFMTGIFGFLGSIFVIIGGSMLVYSFRRPRQSTWTSTRE